MLKIGLKNERKPLGILHIYTFSCLIFLFFSVFNVYKYKVYDTWSLVVFYIYQIILWIGIKIGGTNFQKGNIPKRKINENEHGYSFKINKQGQIIIYCVFIGAFLSFVYFMILYRGSFKITSFGASIKAEYDEVARTKLEVVTQFILYAGSATYLIVNGPKNSVSKITMAIARICLFLPGLRGAFLGRRFTLAVETLVFFFAEYENISNQINNMSKKNRKTLRRIIIVFAIVVFVLLYIFSKRLVYYPDTMFIANRGDMELRPFWQRVYERIGNRMSILAYLSFYAGHAPYSFAYSHAYLYLKFPHYWGLMTCRVFIQIITSLFRLTPNYAQMAREVAGIARYSSYAGQVISDFGLYFGPIAAFLYGYIFAKIERGKNTNAICRSLYPIVQVECIFAPVYFFTVGALDQVAFWAVALSPLCVMKIYLEKRNE